MVYAFTIPVVGLQFDPGADKTWSKDTNFKIKAFDMGLDLDKILKHYTEEMSECIINHKRLHYFVFKILCDSS